VRCARARIGDCWAPFALPATFLPLPRAPLPPTHTNSPTHELPPQYYPTDYSIILHCLLDRGWDGGKINTEQNTIATIQYTYYYLPGIQESRIDRIALSSRFKTRRRARVAARCSRALLFSLSLSRFPIPPHFLTYPILSFFPSVRALNVRAVSWRSARHVLRCPSVLPPP